MARPRCITYSMASVDGRLTIAPGVNLMAGDPRWEAATAGLGDPYDWIRREHDPQVLLEGSGSFISPPTPQSPSTPPSPPTPTQLPTETFRRPRASTSCPTMS